MNDMLLQVQEIGLTYKKLSDSPETAISSEVTFNFIKPFFDNYHGIREAMFAIYLNRANQIIGVQRISEGSLTGTMVDVKIVLKGAIGILATGIILAHNHPSGNLNPSHVDKEFTKKINEACKVMDFVLLDHLILGSSTNYYSFSDHGLI
jgi:DNA repair protein RadC